jgi:hypothetical protein
MLAISNDTFRRAGSCAHLAAAVEESPDPVDRRERHRHGGQQEQIGRGQHGVGGAAQQEAAAAMAAAAAQRAQVGRARVRATVQVVKAGRSVSGPQRAMCRASHRD